MTNEERVMTLFERANPVPEPGQMSPPMTAMVLGCNSRNRAAFLVMAIAWARYLPCQTGSRFSANARAPSGSSGHGIATL